jgi:6-phosphofructokinase 2
MSSIVALTLNPSIDISTSVERLVPLAKLRCATPRVYPGGGGVNVARVAVRLGADVKLIYPVGGATGQLLRRLIEAEAIPNLAVELFDETREDFTVQERATGAEYRFVLPGPQLAEAEWRKCLNAIEAIKTQAAFVVASGSLPPGVPADFYASVVRTAKSGGARAVLDTSGEALTAALAEGVFLVKPNLREFQEALSLASENIPDLIAASREMIRSGKTEIVALTLGEEGSLLITRNAAWRAIAPEVKSVSAVGAGDSFLGAVVATLARDGSLEEALAQGVAAGTAAVLTPGTALCDRKDVERLRKEISVEQL